MSPIKPCPFYDGHDDAEVRQAMIPACRGYLKQKPVPAYYEYRVVCNECNCGGPAGLTEEKAIENWNTRCQTSQPVQAQYRCPHCHSPLTDTDTIKDGEMLFCADCGSYIRLADALVAL